MPYLNKVMLIGNVGKDPEQRVTPSGRTCALFSLATSRRFRETSGETREQTDWHNIVGWGKLADLVTQLGVHKGTTLYIEGTLNYRSWTDQNGQKRYATDVNMNSFQVLTPRGGQGDTQRQSTQAPVAAAAPQYEDIDNLPF